MSLHFFFFKIFLMLFSPAESTEKFKHHSKKQDPPLKYNDFTQTDDNDLKMSANILILDLIKKEKEITVLQQKLNRSNSLEGMIEKLNSLMINSKTAKFFIKQLQLMSKKPKGRRWSDFDISLAILLF